MFICEHKIVSSCCAVVSRPEVGHSGAGQDDFALGENSEQGCSVNYFELTAIPCSRVPAFLFPLRKYPAYPQAVRRCPLYPE
jgi:hypothetical protein